MIVCKIYEEDPGIAWDDFVRQHPRRNPFETRAIYYMYKDSDEFTPYFCIASHSQTNKILGGFLFVIQKKKTLLLSYLFSRALIVGGFQVYPLQSHLFRDTQPAPVATFLRHLSKSRIHLRSPSQLPGRFANG